MAPAMASAQFSADFENPPYVTGQLGGQEGWAGGAHHPRVQTAAEISAELLAAGLNPANPVHSGDQALLWTYTPGEPNGGFWRHPFTGLESETDVVMDFWARPLTPGLEGSTIGFNQGNTFVGIEDDLQTRAAAVRFGVVRDASNMIIGHTIDYASITASNVWLPSGLTWEADQWYNFRFELDYAEKVYDFFVNGAKVNTEPIQFYTPDSLYASTVFISRGTNQAGQILDDIEVFAAGSEPMDPGDFDMDGDVDGNDFLVWQRDHAVGTLDDWKANFGAGAQAAISAVPEPAASTLAFGMVLAIAAWRRKGA
jgi:hypothetical protein